MRPRPRRTTCPCPARRTGRRNQHRQLRSSDQRLLPSFWPQGAATLAESNDALSHSIWSASPKRSKSLLCSLFSHARLLLLLQTPPAAHPRPAAHLLGQSISQGMPLLSTKIMPARAARSSMRTTALGFGWFLGQQWIDHFPKFVCNEYFSHTITLPATQFC